MLVGRSRHNDVRRVLRAQPVPLFDKKRVIRCQGFENGGKGCLATPVLAVKHGKFLKRKVGACRYGVKSAHISDEIDMSQHVDHLTSFSAALLGLSIKSPVVPFSIFFTAASYSRRCDATRPANVALSVIESPGTRR